LLHSENGDKQTQSIQPPPRSRPPARSISHTQVSCTFVHSFIAASFVLFFILETFGITLPYVGFSEVDPTYTSSNSMRLVLMTAAIYLGVVGKLEFDGKMPLEIFTYSHYPLSLALGWFQLQPTTTLIGKVFFSLPHFFTVWSTLSLFSSKSLPSAMV